MRSPRFRPYLFLLAAVLILGVGTVTVEGLEDCKQVIKTFVNKRIPNPVSKKTLAAWALWGKGHPDFKPHYRPKYKITPQEVVKKVDLACERPKTLVDVASDQPPDLPIMEVPAVEFTFPEPNLPDIVQVEYPPIPFQPPYTPGVPPSDLTPVPEPSSLVLVLTGAMFALLIAKWPKLRMKRIA